ncbi:FkbM family methyltransferase [Sphaerospermopsis aphanizomenoides BCCUSP55]|uniref:FkbM family methyltransferase n=1 Tax=Sphaerospermopsis aphanizomenoides TaxID=459663 RepID=UPI0019036DCC|nr:FkbM family methyltransferase [Sphaerospermopsis aphanizomenoides]MBK1988966.1 FkbM family methyltransferase [Sphaerospermopsis aphanizomenoides BCCUSP55]
MQIAGILKPEYFYQPQKILKRIFRFHQGKNDEFIDEILPWGMSIRVRSMEEHGRIISTLGVIDLAVTETLWRLTQPGELVVDVGANIGYMSAVLAARVSTVDGGSVWSFEAHPEIFAELKYNVDNWQKQFTNTQFNIENLAVSVSRGQVKLNIPESFISNRGLASVVTQDEYISENITDKSQSIAIESCCLDEIFPQENIGVLKIDVEGHELQVLQGAVKLLKNARIRDCVFEEHLDYPTPVTNLFESLGYKVFRIKRSFQNPILLEPNSQIPRTNWQPTSFIATRNPQRLMNLFTKPGWQVLKAKRRNLLVVDNPER